MKLKLFQKQIEDAVAKEIHRVLMGLPRPEARDRVSTIREDLDTLTFEADRLDRLSKELHNYAHLWSHKLRNVTTILIHLMDSVDMPADIRAEMLKQIRESLADPTQDVPKITEQP